MVKVFMMAGSLRKESVNKKLINISFEVIKKKALIECSQFLLNDYECSLYNADDEESNGIPTIISDVSQEIAKATHMIFALPEYNGMMPGVFKNFFDWVSRVRPMPWANKKILLISASPSPYGGLRGFTHNSTPFEVCEAFVYPKSFFLADAYNSFDKNAQLKEEGKYEEFCNLLNGFLKF